MSDRSETQEGAIKPKKRFSRTARASKAQNGSPAAAPVETGAAADTRKRRKNTPGGVLKVTLAIDADPCAGSSVVRLGGGISVPLLSRLAGCEGGTTQIRLPQNVKRDAGPWRPHYRGSSRARHFALNAGKITASCFIGAMKVSKPRLFGWSVSNT